MATGTGAGTGFDGDDLLIWIIPAHQFSRDSLLEQAGFEPLVPLRNWCRSSSLPKTLRAPGFLDGASLFPCYQAKGTGGQTRKLFELCRGSFRWGARQVNLSRRSRNQTG
jgi:hypothetical protein